MKEDLNLALLNVLLQLHQLDVVVHCGGLCSLDLLVQARGLCRCGSSKLFVPNCLCAPDTEQLQQQQTSASSLNALHAASAIPDVFIYTILLLAQV